MPKKPSPPIELVYCNSCSRPTRHAQVASRSQQDDHPVDDEVSVSMYTRYDMLECQGCATICMRKTEHFSEWDDDHNEVTFYPPPIARSIPEWIDDLKPEAQGLLRETYRALQADSMRLAMMGARALLDIFIVDAVGDVGTFKQKLLALEKAGHVSTKQVELLDAALDAGHAAVHRGHLPTPTDMNAVMDIVEVVLQLPLLGATAAALKAATPARSKKGKPNGG